MATTRPYHRGGLAESSALSPETAAREFLVVCPKCKTIETLVYMDGHVLTNHRFVETDSGVYHNCGSSSPCRFYQNGESITLARKYQG